MYVSQKRIATRGARGFGVVWIGTYNVMSNYYFFCRTIERVGSAARGTAGSHRTKVTELFGKCGAYPSRRYPFKLAGYFETWGDLRCGGGVAPQS